MNTISSAFQKSMPGRTLASQKNHTRLANKSALSASGNVKFSGGYAEKMAAYTAGAVTNTVEYGACFGLGGLFTTAGAALDIVTNLFTTPVFTVAGGTAGAAACDSCLDFFKKLYKRK